MRYSTKTVYCAAKRIGGGHWAVGGSIPAMGNDDYDEISVFMYVDIFSGLKLHPVKRLVAKTDGGYRSARQWLLDHGYIEPYYRRAYENLVRTAQRKAQTAVNRREHGLKTSAPNPVFSRR